MNDVLPWWVRVAAEPSVMGATAIVAVLLWQGEALLRMTRAALTPAHAPVAAPTAAPAWASGLDALSAAFKPVPGADWTVAIAIALGLAPLFGLAGYGLWTLVERWVGPPMAGPRFPQRAGS
jgi:hypothetical protein